MTPGRRTTRGRVIAALAVACLLPPTMLLVGVVILMAWQALTSDQSAFPRNMGTALMVLPVLIMIGALFAIPFTAAAAIIWRFLDLQGWPTPGAAALVGLIMGVIGAVVIPGPANPFLLTVFCLMGVVTGLTAWWIAYRPMKVKLDVSVF